MEFDSLKQGDIIFKDTTFSLDFILRIFCVVEQIHDDHALLKEVLMEESYTHKIIICNNFTLQSFWLHRDIVTAQYNQDANIGKSVKLLLL